MSGTSIGTGGFGVVHEAVSVDTKQRYAVKVVRKTRSLQTGSKKDPVQKEVEILQSLNHVGRSTNVSESANHKVT